MKKQEKMYVEMIHPLAKLKEETVEYAEKIARELEDGKYTCIVDDEMENVYKLPIDGGESSKAEPPEVGSGTDPTSVLEVSQDWVCEKSEVGSLPIPRREQVGSLFRNGVEPTLDQWLEV